MARGHLPVPARATYNRRMQILLYSLLGSALLLSGCVSKGTYEKLQQDSAALEQRNNEQSTRLQDLQAKVDSQNVLINDLQSKLGKATTNKAQLDQSLAETRQALKEMMERKAEMEKQLAEFRSLTSGLKSLIDTGNVKVRFVKGRMVVSLGSDVLFPSGSARLSPDGIATVETVSKQLAQIPAKDFQVQGHTDNVPIHTKEFPSNWQLASARAINVVSTMIAAGMPAERISASSYADQQPASANDTPEGRAQNRRIDVVVLPDLSKLLNVEAMDRQVSSLAPPPASASAPAPAKPAEEPK